MVEEYLLLPANHIGGKRGNSTEHVIHAMIETIMSVWRENKAVTVLADDISVIYIFLRLKSTIIAVQRATRINTLPQSEPTQSSQLSILSPICMSGAAWK